MITFIILMTKA